MARERLPIDDTLPALLAKLAHAGAVVLRAPTGAGKTTRVPPAIVALSGEAVPVNCVTLIGPTKPTPDGK